MKTISLFLIIIFSFIFKPSHAQVSLDSAKIYYGLTQQKTDKPLGDYFTALEKQGAKLEKIKSSDIEKIKSIFSSASEKKYKKGKHTGTIYFAEGYTVGKKELLVFESSLEKGVLINVTTGKQYILEDKKSIDELYYLLLQIH